MAMGSVACGTLCTNATRSLIQQVKRNVDRFPSDFMFQLTRDEVAALRSQSAISSDGHGGRRYAPYERRLEDLERETKAKLGQHDKQLDEIFQALRQLISPPPQPKRRVGFGLPENDK